MKSLGIILVSLVGISAAIAEPPPAPTEVGDGAVEPLEIWEEHQPENNHKGSNTADDSGLSGEGKRSKSEPVREVGTLDQLEAAYSGTESDNADRSSTFDQKIRAIHSLTKQQVMRVDRVRQLQKLAVAKYRRKLRAAAATNPNGPPEVILCSVSLNGYSSPEAGGRNRKTTKGKTGSISIKDLAAAAGDTRCDILYCTALADSDRAQAKRSFKRIADALTATSNSSWHSLLGETGKAGSYSGFLVRETDRIVVLGAIEHTDKVLPRIEGFSENKFVKAPVELRVTVNGAENNRERELNIIGFDLRRGSQSGEEGLIRYRMQMAEALRQLAELSSSTSIGKGESSTALLGDRGDPYYSASSQILSGRLRLRDFGPTSPCKIGSNNSPECSSKIGQPERLFGVVANGLASPKAFPRGKLSAQNRDPKSLKESTGPSKNWLSQTSDVYLFQQDLKLAREFNRPDAGRPRYVGGTKVIKGGDTNSPLVWVQLNW